ncbi:MAG: hypothetical protein HY391_00295 [Deltaproteobacteria bacterium]|nr:hypothetical protein [Deltaproteobacteria bacterium]
MRHFFPRLPENAASIRLAAMSEKNLTYSDVLRAFSSSQIRYAIVGGFAVVAHGAMRLTMDLDLAITLNTHDLKKAWEILKQLDFKIQQPVLKSDFVNPTRLKQIAQEKHARALTFYHAKQPYLVIDLMIDENAELKDEEIVEMFFLGVRCPIITLKKLIELKAKSDREKDLADARSLRKIKKSK